MARGVSTPSHASLNIQVSSLVQVRVDLSLISGPLRSWEIGWTFSLYPERI